MRREHHRGVAGMHAGELHVLEHSADDHGGVGGIVVKADVGDAVDVHLDGVLEKFIHQHRPLRRGLDGGAHVSAQLVVRVDDLHRAAAKHEGRTHENGVAQLGRRLERLGLVGGQAVGRLRDVERVQHVGEHLAILGALDALRRGADDVDAVGLQVECEIEWGLPAELRDRAPAFFAVINVQHVLERQRLEEKLVAGVVVGGDSFRVGVDHERLEALLLQREGGVYAAVVELDALPDPVRPAAEDHHLFRVAWPHLVIALVVGRVVVRRVRFELRRAGVHQSESRHEAKRMALGPHFALGALGEVGNLPVGEPERLGLG